MYAGSSEDSNTIFSISTPSSSRALITHMDTVLSLRHSQRRPASQSPQLWACPPGERAYSSAGSNSTPGPELSPEFLTRLYMVNTPALLVLAYDSLRTSPSLVLWLSCQTRSIPTGCYDECPVVIATAPVVCHHRFMCLFILKVTSQKSWLLLTLVNGLMPGEDRLSVKD